jgi:hypothetical protein
MYFVKFSDALRGKLENTTDYRITSGKSLTRTLAAGRRIRRALPIRVTSLIRGWITWMLQTRPTFAEATAWLENESTTSEQGN